MGRMEAQGKDCVLGYRECVGCDTGEAVSTGLFWTLQAMVKKLNLYSKCSGEPLAGLRGVIPSELFWAKIFTAVVWNHHCARPSHAFYGLFPASD